MSLDGRYYLVLFGMFIILILSVIAEIFAIGFLYVCVTLVAWIILEVIEAQKIDKITGEGE